MGRERCLFQPTPIPPLFTVNRLVQKLSMPRDFNTHIYVCVCLWLYLDEVLLRCGSAIVVVMQQWFFIA